MTQPDDDRQPFYLAKDEKLEEWTGKQEDFVYKNLDLTKPLFLRDGRKARLLCDDFLCEYGFTVIVAVIEPRVSLDEPLQERIMRFTKEGRPPASYADMPHFYLIND